MKEEVRAILQFSGVPGMTEQYAKELAEKIDKVYQDKILELEEKAKRKR